MQNWQIIIISLSTGAFGSIGAWMLLNILSHDKSITKIESKIVAFEKSVTLLTETFNNFSKKMDDLGKRFDLFVKGEIDELKKVLNQ